MDPADEVRGSSRTAQPAQDTLEVVITKRRLALLTSIVTLPTAVITGVVFYPCRLQIRRRSDRAVLLDYNYGSLSAAAEHHRYIAERLTKLSLDRFCSEYQIAIEKVA